MIISKFGFMDTSISKGKRFLAGGLTNRFYLFDLERNQLILKLNGGFYPQFIQNDKYLLLAKKNGEFQIFDYTNNEMVLKRKLPNRMGILLRRFCWIEKDVIYFQAYKSIPGRESPFWLSIKYDMDADDFSYLNIEGRILGEWKEYLVFCDDIASNDEPINSVLRFYQDDMLGKEIVIGETETVFIVDDHLYVIKNVKRKICIYEYLKDFSCKLIFSIRDKEGFGYGDVFSISKKYIVIGRSRQFTVYMRETNEIVFEQDIPYLMNVTLLEDKIYVGAMDKLYMFKLNE